MKRIVLGSAVIVLAVLALTGCGRVFDFVSGLFGQDLMVDDVEILYSGDEISGLRVRFYNQGSAVDSVKYVVVFSTDETISTAVDFTVYEDWIDLERNGEKQVDISGVNQIMPYVETNQVEIPPGDYYLGVFIDPEDEVDERDSSNNERASSDQFFFGGGSASGQGFEVEIEYVGTAPFDESNPVKVHIYDRDEANPDNDGVVEVFQGPRQGFIPLEALPVVDTNGSGYEMRIVHDLGNNWSPGDALGTEDLEALFNASAGDDHVDYSLGASTPIFPDQLYIARLTHVIWDSSEQDDYPSSAKDLGSGMEITLPWEHHTFHSSEDEDWFWLDFVSPMMGNIFVQTRAVSGTDLPSDPRIQLYQDFGSGPQPLGADPVGDPHETLSYPTAAGGGVFFIQITSEDGVLGEYEITISASEM
jgi:hypothetical protein